MICFMDMVEVSPEDSVAEEEWGLGFAEALPPGLISVEAGEDCQGAATSSVALLAHQQHRLLPQK